RVAVDHHDGRRVGGALVEPVHADAAAEVEAPALERIERAWDPVHHQTISAIEQLRPLPMPISATRMPRRRRPISSAFASAIGTDAGPTLPCSGKIEWIFAGATP